MKTLFSSIVMDYFQYLVTEYSFAITKTEELERAPEIEGRIEFETSMTFVIVSSEQWTISVGLGRLQDDRYRFFLDPLTIHEYNMLTVSDKKLVCSLDPQDDRQAKMILRRLSVLRNKNSSNGAVEDITNRLSDYSKWLRQYAEPFLRGDFSQWLAIYEYKVSRMRAAHIRSGKEEFVRTTSLARDKRISIFQNNLAYLENLREEYGTK